MRRDHYLAFCARSAKRQAVRCAYGNPHLWWGIVLLIFGLTMFILGERRQHKLEKEPPPPLDETEIPRGQGH